MSNPVLSIIIPAFNAEKYIVSCLDSIGDSDAYEIIVIDDGSTDKTAITTSNQGFSNVVIKTNKNHGVSYSRNYGIECAKGKYIMFVDADDVLDKNWFSMINSGINDEDDFVIFSNTNFGDSKTSLFDAILGIDGNKPCLASPCSKFYKRDFLLKNNIRFIEGIINGEDMLFNCQVLASSDKIKVLRGGFYNYRFNAHSATKTYNPKILASDILFHENLYRILENANYENLNFSTKKLGQNGLYIIIDKISRNCNYQTFRRRLSDIQRDFYKKYFDDDSFIPQYERLVCSLYFSGYTLPLFLLLRMLHFLEKLKHSKNEFKKI